MTQPQKLLPIRQQVGIIIGQSIPKGGWKQAFQQLDRDGRIDHRALMQIVVALCEKVEEYEKYE